MTGDAFDALLTYVEDDLSFATSHYNDRYLDRRVSSRMRRTDADTHDAYLQLLQEDPGEQEALLDSMSINVTGFFRNPDVWEEVRSVLRTLSTEQYRVNVWSAACADGREPYSTALLSHVDPEIDESSVRILGTDISEPALETAREGRYQSSKTRNIGDELAFLDGYEEYVSIEDNSFQIDDAVRRTVDFERHDLINDRPKSGFDLVFCRNLFIYIDEEYKESMLRTIARSMDSDGYLVIGKAETIPPALKPMFAEHDSRLRIYRKDEH
ncbi:protein-glutamate O-methyltransferase CheR [Halobacteria archaeon AArc-dxtr1]|nr:protein-glutamate O-methyltransferase CheR [Halobacteria archaeon AArc-dxtr1]